MQLKTSKNLKISFFRRQKYLGKIKFAQFDSISADRAIVVTEENVLAAMSSKNGDILWRRVLETDDTRGDIKFLYVTRDSKNIVSQSSDVDPFGVITVSGINPVLFRGWDITNGNLAWEWSLTPTSAKADDAEYFFRDSNIYQVLPVWNSHIEITEYYASSGQQNRPTTSKITAGWITKDKCVLSLNYFVCLVKDQLLVLDVLADKNNVRSLAVEPANDIKVLNGVEGFVQVGRQVVSLEDLKVIFSDRNSANLYVDAGNKIIQLFKADKDVKILLEDQELSVLSDVPDNLDNNLQVLSVKCRPKRENLSQLACRFLLTTDDGAIVLVQQSKVKWVREEALTQIAAIEFLDLTLSDAQGAIEEELNNKDGESLGSLSHKIYNFSCH